MSNIAQEIIRNSPYVILLPLVAGIITFKKNTTANRILTVHIGLAAVFTAVSAVMWYKHQNNLPLSHVYTVLEFVFLSVYYSLVYPDRQMKTTIRIVVLLFVVFAVLNVLYLQDIYQYNTYARSVQAFIMMVYGLGGYFMVLQQKNTIYNTSFFWINTGYLVYFSVSLFLFMLNNYLIYLGRDVVLVSWAIHALVMALLYILVSIGLWKTT